MNIAVSRFQATGIRSGCLVRAMLSTESSGNGL